MGSDKDNSDDDIMVTGSSPPSAAVKQRARRKVRSVKVTKKKLDLPKEKMPRTKTKANSKTKVVSKVKHPTQINNKTPIRHFMRQYVLLQNTLRAAKSIASKSKAKQADTVEDHYTFLTYATKRFIVVLARIIQESDKRFDLSKWSHSMLGQFKMVHSTSKSESASAAYYLESIFGKMPSDIKSSLFDVNAPKPYNKTQCIQADQDSIWKETGYEPIPSLPPPIETPPEVQIVTPQKRGRVSNYQKIEKIPKTEPEIVEEIEDDGDNDIGGVDDDGDDIIGNDEDNEEGCISSLLCVYCFKRKFPDIKSLVKHFQDVHMQADTLEYWLNVEETSMPLTAKQKKAEINGPSKTKYIKCGLCTFKIEDNQNLEPQELVSRYAYHYAESHHPKHKCTYCRKMFYREEVLRLHQDYCEATLKVFEREMPKEKPIVYYYMRKRCGLHKVDFTDEFIYADHLAKFHIHEVDGGEIANVLGLNVKELLSERNMLMGIQYICHMCGEERGKFENPNDWISHVHEAHVGRIICDICCQFVGSLKQHVKNAHGTFGESYFVCIKDDCKYRGAGFSTLFQHVRNFHPDVDLEEPLEFRRKCMECDTYVSYRYHKKLIDYKKPTRTLFNHYGTAHDKRFCEKCGNFYTRKYYDIHQESHLAEETGIKKYSCGVCNQRFLHKSTLLDHERRHDNRNKTHLCDICCKSFFFRSDLNTHIKTNHAEKAYRCEHCNKTFALQTGLRQHFRKSTCGSAGGSALSVLSSGQKRFGPFPNEAPACKMEKQRRRVADINELQPMETSEEMKVPLTDDMRLSMMPPPVTTDMAGPSHLTLATPNLTTQAPDNTHARMTLEQQVPQNLSMNAPNVLTTYYNEQPMGVFNEVYRATHQLGMMLPGFNLAGDMQYGVLPQQHHHHQE